MDWLSPLSPDDSEQHAAEVGSSLRAAGIVAGIAIVGLAAAWIFTSIPRSDQGLQQTWYSDPKLTNEVAVERAGPIDHRWRGAPREGVPAKGFSVSWRGCVRITEPDTRLVARSDDGFRVLIDGNPVVPNWNRPTRHYWRSSGLRTGVRQIEIDYRHDKGPAYVYLGWAHANHAHRAIPAWALLPPDHPECAKR